MAYSNPGKYVVIAHGSAAETDQAKRVIESTEADSSEFYEAA